jgi:hypothetical protein
VVLYTKYNKACLNDSTVYAYFQAKAPEEPGVMALRQRRA